MTLITEIPSHEWVNTVRSIKDLNINPYAAGG